MVDVPLGETAATVDGLECTSLPGDWVIEEDGIGGWYDGAPIRSDAPDRPDQHGSFGLPAYRTGRIVTLTVAALCPDVMAAGRARAVLTGVLADGGYGPLEVTDPDGLTTSAIVRLDAQPMVQWRPWSNTLRAQLQFFAPDPYRYGDSRAVATTLPELVGGLEFDLFTDGTTDTGQLEFGAQGSTGRIVLANAGNAPAWPIFSVAGPAPQGFTLTNVETGRTIVSTTVIPTGSTLTIDSDTGTAFLDGADRSGQLVRRDWTPVPAYGSSQWAFSAPTFTGTVLTATIKDTWY